MTNAKAAMDTITGNSKPVAGKVKAPVRFSKLCDRFGQTLHFPQSYRDTLAVMCAVTLSNKTPGEPLWLHVVGPPSSGKSTLCEAIGEDKDHVVSMSKLTGLLSGWRDEQHVRNARAKRNEKAPAGEEVEEDPDYSPILKMLGKTVCIKDFTTVMTLPSGTQDNLFGELRDAYDGSMAAFYRNGRPPAEHHGIRFTIITGVTDEINRFNRSTLGERFLKKELIDPKAPPRREAAMSAARNMLESLGSHIEEGAKSHHAAIQELRTATKEFLLSRRPLVTLDRLAAFADAVKPGSPFEVRVSAVAQLCGVLRANVERSRGEGDTAYRPRPEMGSRLTGQLTKLAVMLSFVTDEPADSPETWRLVKQVALDTSVGYNQEIVLTLAKSREPLSSESVAEKLMMPKNTIYRRIADLMELGAVQKSKAIPNGSFFGGRPTIGYELTPYVRDLVTDAELVETPKPTPRRKR